MKFTTAGNGELVYRIDCQGRIVEVNDAWDHFAMANGAPELTRGAVLGRPLNDFIDGSETLYVYDRIIRRAHELGRALSLPFRCDSHTARRWMRMTIMPLSEGTAFRTRVLSVAARIDAPVLEPPAHDGLVTFCSWCNKVRGERGWLEVEEAVVEMQLFDGERLPGLTHGICHICELEVSSTWDPADERSPDLSRVVQKL